MATPTTIHEFTDALHGWLSNLLGDYVDVYLPGKMPRSDQRTPGPGGDIRRKPRVLVHALPAGPAPHFNPGGAGVPITLRVDIAIFATNVDDDVPNHSYLRAEDIAGSILSFVEGRQVLDGNFGLDFVRGEADLGPSHDGGEYVLDLIFATDIILAPKRLPEHIPAPDALRPPFLRADGPAIATID